MGRTQPSYTRAVDEELEKVERIVSRLNSPILSSLFKEVKNKIRYTQSASYDEFVDPYNLVYFTMIWALAEECEKWKNMYLTHIQSKGE
ncbi:DNA polymerase II [Acidianus sulfidivorans JP7]|uniref:DNA polymerase II n=1 Tax=Acidianus sulfidivorans JP7 TaxID=619593 RepID=A0A2U9IJK9_9CREN|nr:DNA polymerase II [Acidianus sulfidivorans]AWR96227.1 DNA polymerase II [Acidianus sulfidivorans JP7]